MSCKRLGIGAIALLALAGCSATSPLTSINFDPEMGEAVKYNAAIHTIDPDPVYAEGSAQPGASGVKGAEAIERYRTDQVKDVETLNTGSTSSGGGGGPQ